MKSTYGLLIDYEFCTGCCSCEVSCKEEHNYTVGQWGIRVHEDGPWSMGDDMWNWNKIAVPTDLCDLCSERTAVGREPICVHHCLANVISFGTVEELAEKLAAKPKQALYVPQYKPLEAKGPFVSKHAGESRRISQARATQNEDFQNTVHRSDARVDLVDIEEVKDEGSSE